MKPTLALAVVCFLAASFVTNASTQERAQASPTVSTDADYRIKAGDTISLYIIRMPELSRDYSVTSEGTIEVPFLGAMTVLKKTSREVAAMITNGLRGDFLVDPQVAATVKPSSYRFFVQGAVRSPGVYTFETRPSLLELISLAGGLTPTYGATAFIIHKFEPSRAEGTAADAPDPQVGYELKKVNINALLRGEFSENVRVDPGDIVQIPAADLFFVAGEVKAPGSFSLKEGTTLRQAISLAQGTSPTASPSKGIIFREDSNGQKKEIPVDVGDIMKGKNPDIAILANDIIVIPNSKTKSILLPIVNAFGVSAITTVPQAIVR